MRLFWSLVRTNQRSCRMNAIFNLCCQTAYPEKEYKTSHKETLPVDNMNGRQMYVAVLQDWIKRWSRLVALLKHSE